MANCEAGSSASYTLDDQAQSPSLTVNCTFTGGKIQLIPLDDGDDNGDGDNWTIYTGPGLSVISFADVYNGSGWTIFVDPNGGGSPMSITPGSSWTYRCAGDQDTLDNLENPLYSLDIEIESSEGAAGDIKVTFLGVA